MNAIAIVKDGRHDFDFFYGQWAVQHRLLKRRGAHCEEWLEFFGTAQCRGLMGGLELAEKLMDDEWRSSFPAGSASSRRAQPSRTSCWN